MITIKSNLLGSKKHLLFKNNQYSWVHDIEKWNYGGINPFSIERLASTWNREIPVLIEDKYQKMAETLNSKAPVWPLVLGKTHFKSRLSFLIKSISEFMEDVKDSKYLDTYKRIEQMIFSLKPAPANTLRFRTLVASGHNFPGFSLNSGYFNPPIYNRSTKTGRLKVIQGPSVLTLRSEHRNIVKDCFQVDFSSMEPRFLLACVGHHVEGDLYDWIARKTGLNGSRAYIKVATISSMYGSRTIPEVAKLFAIAEWIKQLEADISDDVLENYFGRPIFVRNIRGHHLLSLWLQSSAADASLLGFANLFLNNPDIKAHWIIHDGAIFSKERLSNLPQFLKITEEINLPVKYTEI